MTPTHDPTRPRTPRRAPAAKRTPGRSPPERDTTQERLRLPDGPAGPPRISIERPDPNRAVPVQSLPPAVAGVAGFIEAPDDDPDSESHLPPCLDSD
jgi:hypothetical protein